MASSYPGPVTAIQVGSYFVGQYYQALKQQPDLLHQFYSDDSKMIRVDGESVESANTMMQIHTMVMSLNITSIEVKTINSLDSWNGGVLVLVSGSIKTKDFSGRRKFVQTFFLAPQEKGYFLLNDMFQFVDEGSVYQQHLSPMPAENVYQQPAAPITSEDAYNNQINASIPHPEPPASNNHYGFEEEATEYVSAVHIEDDSVDKYSLPDQQHYDEYEAEVVVEETPVEEMPSAFQGSANVMQDPPTAPLDEPAEEPTKKTYASILRVAKGQTSPPVTTRPAVTRTSPTTSDWNHVQPSHAQSDSGMSFANEIGAEIADDGLGDEGEPKSVYVRNLPSDVTAEEIEQEFKNFGRIKDNGIFIRNRKDVVGVCYAFIEFEDLVSVQNAIKSSPIQLAGRQVYIEERRPNSGFASRGGRGRGRGRGGYQSDAPRGRFGGRSLGRGTNQDADYKTRSNGSYQRGSR